MGFLGYMRTWPHLQPLYNSTAEERPTGIPRPHASVRGSGAIPRCPCLRGEGKRSRGTSSVPRAEGSSAGTATSETCTRIPPCPVRAPCPHPPDCPAHPFQVVRELGPKLCDVDSRHFSRPILERGGSQSPYRKTLQVVLVLSDDVSPQLRARLSQSLNASCGTWTGTVAKL